MYTSDFLRIEMRLIEEERLLHGSFNGLIIYSMRVTWRFFITGFLIPWWMTRMIDVNFFQRACTIQFFKYPFARARVSSSLTYFIIALNQKSISFEIHFPFLSRNYIEHCTNTAKLLDSETDELTDHHDERIIEWIPCVERELSRNLERLSIFRRNVAKYKQ